MKESLNQLIPEFSVRLGGTTSVDVTKPGIDKAYGIRKLGANLGISMQRDDFYRRCVVHGRELLSRRKKQVWNLSLLRGPEETKRVIEAIIACLADRDRAACE